MPIIKLGDLTTYTGSTDGVYLVINDSGNVATYKIQKESLMFPYQGQADITGGLTITGSFSTGEGNEIIGNFSVAEGSGSMTGLRGAYLADSIVSGSVTIDPSYGNITSDFIVDEYLFVYDSPFDSIVGKNAYRINTVSFDVTSTKIQIDNTSINTGQSYVFCTHVTPLNGDITIPANYSHVEGLSTMASGDYSHAEGYGSTAIGNGSHAESFDNLAIGIGSHAEGIETLAAGVGSHSEGLSSEAYGSYSHAEGAETRALGNYSHAKGAGAISFGEGSHAEGFYTLASGIYSHAEGFECVAIGNSSHAEGLSTTAIGDYQHVQGQFNISSFDQSAFIIGNGIDDSNRSNLVFASGSQFQISGSLELSGSIRFLEGGIIRPNDSGQVGSVDIIAGTPTGWAELQSYNAEQYVWVDNDGSYIGTNWLSGAKIWIFDRSGSLTVPGDIVGAQNLATTGSNSFIGDQTVTGSITLTNLLTLATLDPLPTSNVPSASLMASGSGADLKPYFWNGESWTALF